MGLSPECSARHAEWHQKRNCHLDRDVHLPAPNAAAAADGDGDSDGEGDGDE